MSLPLGGVNVDGILLKNGRCIYSSFSVVLCISVLLRSAKYSFKRNLLVKRKTSSANLTLSWDFIRGQKPKPFPKRMYSVSDNIRSDKFKTVSLPCWMCFFLFWNFLYSLLFLNFAKRLVFGLIWQSGLSLFLLKFPLCE